MSEEVMNKVVVPISISKPDAPISKPPIKPLTRGARAVRNPRNPNEIVLMIGGWTSSLPDGPTGNIEAGGNFDVTFHPWRTMKFPLVHKRAYHGIGLVNNTVIVFGGFNKLDNFSEESLEESYPKSTFAFDTIKKVRISKI